jgi:dihydrofolate synthase/folylpolyglutamate synthase
MTDSLADWLDRLERRHPKTIDLGLDRCSQVYRNMGSPRPAPMVFSVAGTNGKGSTVAYIATVLAAMGYRCGTYTSPHLLEFNERVQIAGMPATDDDLIRAFEVTEQARDDISLTYFEFTTLAAFWLMQQSGLDAAVLEVGLGGRLDTVNMIDADCAVITPIGLDHQHYLGPDRESIGREKAGIMRAGITVICSDRAPPSSVRNHALETGADLQVLGEAFDVRSAGNEYLLRTATESFRMPEPPLAGRHQRDNLAAALIAVHRLVPGIPEHRQQWSGALKSLRLAGRLATVASDRRFIIDVGHNPLAARAVARHLEKLSRNGRRMFCILAMLKDKDTEQVSLALNSVIDHWYCAGLTGERGQSGEELAQRLAKALPGSNVRTFETVAQAVDEARSNASDNDRVLVFGSFETAACALRVFSGTR